jgi:hypothetical protein
MNERSLFAAHALLPTGWARDVRLSGRHPSSRWSLVAWHAELAFTRFPKGVWWLDRIQGGRARQFLELAQLDVPLCCGHHP